LKGEIKRELSNSFEPEGDVVEAFPNVPISQDRLNPVDRATGKSKYKMITDPKTGKPKEIQNPSFGLLQKAHFEPEGESVDERTRYAKETGKDPQTGKPSVKGGNPPPAAMRGLERELRSTGGLMSSRRKPIKPQGKKKEPGAKGYQGRTPVDRIRAELARKRAPKPNPYRPRAGESD